MVFPFFRYVMRINGIRFYSTQQEKLFSVWYVDLNLVFVFEKVNQLLMLLMMGADIMIMNSAEQLV